MERNAVKSEIQRIVIEKLDALGMTQRRFADEFPDYSIATYGTWRRQENAMGLDVLEKILFKYPDLKLTLSEFFGFKNSKNLTAATNIDEVYEDLRALREIALSQQKTIEILSAKV